MDSNYLSVNVYKIYGTLDEKMKNNLEAKQHFMQIKICHLKLCLKIKTLTGKT